MEVVKKPRAPRKPRTNNAKKVKLTSETSSIIQDTNIQTQISREIQENKDGSRFIREVQTSNEHTRKIANIKKQKETIYSHLQYLSEKRPALVDHSPLAKSCINTYYADMEEFESEFENFDLKNEKQLQSAMYSYNCAPLVHYSWDEIYNSAPGIFKQDQYDTNLQALLTYKLILAAINDNNDHLGDLTLKKFNVDNQTACITLTIAPDKKFDIQLTCVDPYFLLMLPKDTCRKKVEVKTRLLAHDYLRDLATDE